MKILVSSHRYSPDVGGIETVSGLLAAEWRLRGHEVHVVTQTPARSADDESPFVHRRPTPARLFALVRDCDVYWHSNISLQTAWPLLFLRRPWFITAHTWLHGVDGRVGWRDRLKRIVHTRANNLFPSECIAAHIGCPGVLVGNPYHNELFRRLPNIHRDRELVFVGRLVGDKGADVLLRALHHLPPGKRPSLTIVGQGPAEPALRTLAAELGIADTVSYVGPLRGEALVATLNAHRVLVIPSRWEEPFGIVSLEGLACGCRVIASASGGLPEAVGPAGTLFANGDAAALAHEIAFALAAPPRTEDAPDVHAHLERFSAPRVAEHYLQLFQAALNQKRK